MKKRKVLHLSLVVVMLIAFSLLFVQVVSAEPTVPTCEADLVFAGMQEGSLSYPGGRMHIRGREVSYDQTSEENLCVGTTTVTINANWDALNTGPVWGTFLQDEIPNIDGGWDGIFKGKRGPNGAVIFVNGHGYGDLEGWKVSGTIEYSDPTKGIANMTIFDPHGE